MLIRIGTNTYIPGEEIYYVTDYTSNSTVNMVRKAKTIIKNMKKTK